MYENDMKTIQRAQNGSKDDMTKLVEDNNGLIWSIVKRFTGRGYDIEDLYQIACIGFIKSIQRFDTSFEVRLSTYAVPYILGEIKKFLRDDGPVKVSRSLRELNTKIAEIQKEYLKQGKELNLLQISEILKIPKEEIAMAMEIGRPTESIEESIYDSEKSNKSLNIIDTLSTNQDEAGLIIDKITIQRLIEDLDSRDKELILLRFYKNKTQTEVAKILGISQVQVSRIEKKILNGMKTELVS